jgi:hypothetical protein
MKNKYLALIVVVAFIASASSSLLAATGKITVTQTAEKITITGDKGKKINSDKFTLSKDGWYIIKIAYTGPDVSICQLSLATQKMVTDKETVGGLLTNWMEPMTTEKILSKGAAKSEDYMIYVDDAEGPWTIEILKSPKPKPLSDKTTFSGTTNKVTPFFHLNKGSAAFTMHQKLKGQWSSRLEINLYDATTGKFVDNLCHNSTTPTLDSKVDVPEAGPYVLEVIGGDSWDVSFKQ